jgi:hypothetical protein
VANFDKITQCFKFAKLLQFSLSSVQLFNKLKMKLVVGILLIFAVGGAFGQAGLTNELLAAQADLALTHEFFETIMAINRGQLSSYIYRISRIVIDSHMDTYEKIYTEGNEARTEIEALQPQNPGEEACVNRFLTRFELQKQR